MLHVDYERFGTDLSHPSQRLACCQKALLVADHDELLLSTRHRNVHEIGLAVLEGVPVGALEDHR
ncbi:hypothetical protein D3C78_1906430 [compost metagenome]